MRSIVSENTGKQCEWQVPGYPGIQEAENLAITSPTYNSLALPHYRSASARQVPYPEEWTQTVVTKHNYGPTVNTMSHGNISQSVQSMNIWSESFAPLIAVLKALTPFSTKGLVSCLGIIKPSLKMRCCTWHKPFTWRFSMFCFKCPRELRIYQIRRPDFFIPKFLTLLLSVTITVASVNTQKNELLQMSRFVIMVNRKQFPELLRAGRLYSAWLPAYARIFWN